MTPPKVNQITLTRGATVNVGEYTSQRFEVQVNVQVFEDTDHRSAILWAYELVTDELEREIAVIVGVERARKVVRGVNPSAPQALGIEEGGRKPVVSK